MKKGLFDLRLSFDDVKIIDQKVNSMKEVNNIMKDVKEKFK